METIQKTYNFVTLDFEFSMLDYTSFVLISGAISNTLDRFKIIKLQGNPLVLPKEGKARKLTKCRMKALMIEMIRIFKNDTDKLTPLLAQLYGSLSSRSTTLTARFIRRYLDHENRKTVIVLWSGDTDKSILDRLNITGYTILNIVCYDTHNNRSFNIQLSNMMTKEVIFSSTIIHDETKVGRLLSLKEAHSILCFQKHNITYVHDPLTDVRYTKCIFDKIIKKHGFMNLLKYLYSIS